MAGTLTRRGLARLCGALVLLALIAAAALPASRAQDDVRYFAETGHTLRGQFRAFWEGNGGLATFGFPITEEFADQRGVTVQWFERARFELGAGQVGLGNLGVEVTEGRAFPKARPIANTADRRYIPETQHIIQYGFKEIWETRGAERIFGFPISEEIDEVLENGEWHTVQYFEKARFEYWPSLPPGQRVLISLLGRRLAPAERLAPVAPPAPGQPAPAPPAPTAAPAPPLPASQNARVVPESGPPGTVFRLEAGGFAPGEPVGIWITAPDQSTYGADFQAEADAAGSISAASIGVSSDSSFAEGVWSFNAQGVRSGRQAVGYFLISRVVPPGDPARLGAVAHDDLPRQGQADILPVAAPPGAAFLLTAGGFAADEQVSAWVTGPDGASRPVEEAQVDAGGGVAYVLIDTAGLPEGVYTAVAQGRRSGALAAAAFRLTRAYIAGPGTPRPANVNGSATPAEAGPGAVVQIRGQGLAPGEPLDFWLTDPSGAYLLFPEGVRAEADGRIGYNPNLDLVVQADSLAGVYGIHFRGRQSGARVDIYFTVSAGARGAGQADWLRSELLRALGR